MSDNKDKAVHFKAANAAAKDSSTAAEIPGSCVATCPVKDAPPARSKVLRVYFARKVITESGHGKTKTKQLSFEAIANAVIGYKICIIVETSDLPGGDVSVEILGSKCASFVDEDKAATFLSEGEEKSTFTAKVGNYQSQTAYSNAAAFKDKAIIEVELKAKEDGTTKDWIGKIGASEDKKAYLHLSVTATGGNDTEYNCEDDILASPNKEKGIFFNKKDAWFELYACLCGKKLIAVDLELLGISKANATKFLEGINTAIENYHINTCLRIAHFMAQVRHESEDFVYLKEIWTPTPTQLGYEGRDDLGNSETGDGEKFMGRGLLQITGRTNYSAYETYKGEDFTTGENNKKLEQIIFAVDSAGWYWSEKLNVDLNNGTHPL